MRRAKQGGMGAGWRPDGGGKQAGCRREKRQRKQLIEQLTQAGFIHYAIHAALFLEQNARPCEVCKQG